MSQPKGLVPFLPFSLIPVPGLLLALPYPPLFKRSLCFCIVFEFRLSHQQLIAVTHTHPRRCFVHGFLFFFTAVRGRLKTLGVRSGQRRQWWVAEVLFLVYLLHTLSIGLCWAALYCLPCMTKVFFALKLYLFFFLIWRKCLFIRFCSCGCSMSPFFTSRVGHPELFSVLDVILSPRITCIMTKQKNNC